MLSSKTTLAPEDLELIDPAGTGRIVKGPLKVGANRHGTVHTPPRPLVGPGPQRYLFEVIALMEAIDTGALRILATKEELAGAS
jgi:hypothetical protein